MNVGIVLDISVFGSVTSRPAVLGDVHCTRLSGCIRLRNDLYCVRWDVKLYSLTIPVRCVLCCVGFSI